MWVLFIVVIAVSANGMLHTVDGITSQAIYFANQPACESARLAIGDNIGRLNEEIRFYLQCRTTGIKDEASGDTVLPNPKYRLETLR